MVLRGLIQRWREKRRREKEIRRAYEEAYWQYRLEAAKSMALADAFYEEAKRSKYGKYIRSRREGRTSSRLAGLVDLFFGLPSGGSSSRRRSRRKRKKPRRRSRRRDEIYDLLWGW